MKKYEWGLDRRLISFENATRYPRRIRRAATTPYGAYVNIMKMLTDEPASYDEVLGRSDFSRWQAAMEDEYRSLVTLPRDCHALPSRWVFVIKRDPLGNIEKYKARVVATGFRQVAGRDYGEVYAPVSKDATMRGMSAHVAVMDLELFQLDVKTACLNGDLEEDIFMKPPPGEENSGKVWRLRKALFGLKQAARAWHHKLRDALKDLDCLQTAKRRMSCSSGRSQMFHTYGRLGVRHSCTWSKATVTSWGRRHRSTRWSGMLPILRHIDFCVPV
jgi:hypothetical protein